MSVKTTKSILLTYLLCMISLSTITSIQAFPAGAGVCQGGQAAVGGVHLTNTPIVTGSLSEGGFELILGNEILVPNTAYPIVTNELVSLYVRSDANQFFRGILIRMEGFDETDIVLITTGGFQGASVCEDLGLVGITHTDPEDKTGLTKIGDFLVTSVQGITVDVTIVVSNNDIEGSEYYYDAFEFNIVTELTTEPPQLDTLEPTLLQTMDPTMETTRWVVTTAPTMDAATLPPTTGATTSPTTPDDTASPTTNVTILGTLFMTTMPPTTSVTTMTTQPPDMVTTSPSEEIQVTEEPSMTPVPTPKESVIQTEAPTKGRTGELQTSNNSSSLSSGTIIGIVCALVFLICFLVGSFLYYKKMQQSTSSGRPDNQGVAASYTLEAQVADVIATEIDTPPIPKPNNDKVPHHNVAGVHPNLPRYKDQARTVVYPHPELVDEGGDEEVPVVSAKLADVTLDEEEDPKPRFRLDP